ncbi:hypothetical protein QP794_00595 [Paenibacillus sp. UMB7766-LJ446]|nr:hypothetical protein [Paenibacillus sp. UMB7766-LJ446]
MNSKFVLHKWGEEDDYCLGEYNHFFHFDFAIMVVAVWGVIRMIVKSLRK